MEITKAIIKDNTVILTVNNANDLNKIYLDSVSNYKNIESSDDNVHTKVITQFFIEDNIIVLDIQAMKENAFVVTLISDIEKVQALAIDNDAIYKLKVKMLTNLYGKCLTFDDKEKIIMVHFRSNLFQYAIDNNLLYDSIMHYKSLDRILNDRKTNNICCI